MQKLMAAAALVCVANLCCGAEPGSAATFVRAAEGAQNASTFTWASGNKASASTFIWASRQAPKTKPNPRGLFWRAATRTEADYGRALYLIEPGRCPGSGQPCLPETIVGGYLLADQEYRAYDGRTWGAAGDPPIDLPDVGLDEAAAALAAALVGLVAEAEPDCPPGTVCFPQSTQRGFPAYSSFRSNSFPVYSSYSSGPSTVSTSLTTSYSETFSDAGSTVYVSAGPRMGIIRRIVTAPFRAVRAVRQARAARLAEYTVVEARPMPSYPVGSTVTTYEMTPRETYRLEPVTTQVPVTSYQWVPRSAKPPEMPKGEKK